MYPSFCGVVFGHWFLVDISYYDILTTCIFISTMDLYSVCLFAGWPVNNGKKMSGKPTSLLNILRWVKDKTKRRNLVPDDVIEPPQPAPPPPPQQLPLPPNRPRILPPTDRDENGFFPSEWRCASPSTHIYEEIPDFPLELDGAGRVKECNVTAEKLDKLDFARAREIGPYLVVPIVDNGKVRPGSPGEEDSNPCARPWVHRSGEQQKESSTHCMNCIRLQDVCNGTPLRKSDEENLYNSIQSLQTMCLKERNRKLEPKHCKTDSTDTFNEYDIAGSDEGIHSPREDQAPTESSTDTYSEYDISAIIFSRDKPNVPHVNKTRKSRSREKNALFFKSRRRRTLLDSTDSEYDKCNGSSGTSTTVSPRSWESDGKHTGSSNDSFSEYDLANSDVSSEDPYKFYLTKVEHNLLLKQEVMKMIHSESSESESVSGAPSCASPLSLACEAIDERPELLELNEDEIQKSIRMEHRRRHSLPSGGKSSKKKGRERRSKREPKQTISEGTKATGEEIETYSLPEDCSKLSKSKSQAVSEENPKTKDNHPKPKDERIEPKRESSPVLYEQIDVVDKLSCRATNFNLNRSMRQPHGKVKKSPSTSSASSIYGTNTAKPEKAKDHNRLLSDLMRMNHDRQLLLF